MRRNSEVLSTIDCFNPFLIFLTPLIFHFYYYGFIVAILILICYDLVIVAILIENGQYKL